MQRKNLLNHHVGEPCDNLGEYHANGQSYDDETNEWHDASDDVSGADSKFIGCATAHKEDGWRKWGCVECHLECDACHESEALLVDTECRC